MEELLDEFERIVILKTLIFDVDLNFIGENDLNKIISEANTMEVDLNCIKYDELDYFTYDELIEIYEEWRDDVIFMFDDIRNQLLNKLNG